MPQESPSNKSLALGLDPLGPFTTTIKTPRDGEKRRPHQQNDKTNQKKGHQQINKKNGDRIPRILQCATSCFSAA